MLAHITRQQPDTGRRLAPFQTRQTRAQGIDERRGLRRPREQGLSLDEGQLHGGERDQHQCEQRPRHRAPPRRSRRRLKCRKIVEQHRRHVQLRTRSAVLWCYYTMSIGISIAISVAIIVVVVLVVVRAQHARWLVARVICGRRCVHFVSVRREIKIGYIELVELPRHRPDGEAVGRLWRGRHIDLGRMGIDPRQQVLAVQHRFPGTEASIKTVIMVVAGAHRRLAAAAACRAQTHGQRRRCRHRRRHALRAQRCAGRADGRRRHHADEAQRRGAW